MNIQCHLDEKLTRGLNPETLPNKLKSALILLRYALGELSLGESAELMGRSHYETMQWFEKIGLSTHSLSKKQRKHSNQTLEKLLQQRNIKI